MPCRFDPHGRVNELERFTTLMTVSRCRNIQDVPRAVELWETDWSTYKERTGEELPERLRTNLLLKIGPSEFEEEIRLRFVAMDQGIDYDELRQRIFDFALRKAPGAKHLGALAEGPADLPGPGEENLEWGRRRRNRLTRVSTQQGQRQG